MSETTAASPIEISAERLKELVDGGEQFTLVDTRGDESYEGWRMADAVQFFYKPGDDFDPEEFESTLDVSRDDPIVTICAKGKSSRFLADELVDAGFTDVRHVEDGMRGWSAVYDAATVDIDGDVEIVQIQRRAKGCIGYLIADPDTKAAAAVDATRHVEEFLDAADDRDWRIERVLDTHIHADHISGGRRLADRIGVPYHLGERAAERDPDFEYDPLGRNEAIEIGTVDIKSLFTPGHTSEMASYLVDGTALLTGDTVFVDSVGRTELQFGDADAASGAAMLYDSLHGTVLAEPDPITVLPGHFAVSDHGEYGVDPGSEISTTVRELRTERRVLRRDREEFVEYVSRAAPEKPPNYERIIDINRGQTDPEESEAIDLELGTNRCAAE